MPNIGKTGEKLNILLLDAIKKELIKLNKIPFSFSSSNIFYQVNSNTYPNTASKGDWLIVTSNGNSSGIIKETWIFDGVNWIGLSQAYKELIKFEVVNTYNDLPLPNTVVNEFYWVENDIGTKWLPGSLGGTYYKKGLYYSNGSTWETAPLPYQATQVEVDAGINNDKFITPATLKGNLNKSTFTIELITQLTVDFYAPYDLRINSITNILNTPTTTLKINDILYALNDLILQGDKITVELNVNGVVNLNIVYE